MKIIALAVLLTIMQAVPPVPRKTSDAKTGSGQTVASNADTDKADTSPIPSSPQLAASDVDATKAGPNKAANKQQSVRIVEPSSVSVNRDWVDCVAIFLSLSLVAIAGIGTWVAVRSLNLLREQTAATQRAADAAFNSTQSLIDSERPWITASIRKTVREMPVVRDGVVVQNLRQSTSYFGFVLKNLGRTPAEIIAVRGAPDITRNGIDGGLSPDSEPDYGLPSFLTHVKMLAPSEEWERDELLTLFHYHAEQLDRIRRAQDHIIFAGVILYKDGLNPKVIHETRFCYTYLSMLDDYRPSGPHQYTKYT